MSGLPPPLSQRTAASPGSIGAEVRRFYETLPFNFHGNVGRAVATIRSNPVAATYPDLHALLQSGQVRTVLEIGCGAGWLANSLALHYPVQVTAVDFASSALSRAAELATALGTSERIRFVESNLFDYQHTGSVSLLISLGVLHHTASAESAFQHVQRFVGDGQFVYIGLYHEPGRRVFLDRFRTLLAAKGEAAAFARYRQLDHVRATDETLARSWFRDQVLHPHETQHTLREACRWLRDAGLTLQSTSINGFGEIGDLEALFELELGYAERSRRAHDDEGRYFPGFFTFLARR